MKKIFKTIIASIAGVSLVALVNNPSVKADKTDTFISSYKADVSKASKKYNLYGSVMMAQAALESAWGQSDLTTQANNFFGIKGTFNGDSVEMPTFEFDKNGQMYQTTASFKRYPTPYDSFADNGNTLRNGTSWDPNYYSGTWKEVASTYADAANYLTNRYATAPTYGQSLINLIQQYQFDNVFNEQPGSSHSEPENNNGTDTNQPEEQVPTPAPTPVPTPKPVANVKYYGAVGTERVSFSAKYNKYYLYNHVKGTNKNETKVTARRLGITAGTSAYVDMRGVKKNQNAKTTWYRVRFNKNPKATKYWVYSKALQFAPVKYEKPKGSITVGANQVIPTYNHVLESNYLAKQLPAIKTTSPKKLTVNGMGIKQLANHQFEVWYRVNNQQSNAWLKANSWQLTSNVAQTVYFNTNEKAVPTSFRTNVVYNHVPGTYPNEKHYSLQSLKLNVNKYVKVNKLAYKVSDHSLWYRLVNPNTNKTYWIKNPA